MVFIYYSLLLCALLYTTIAAKQRSSIIHSRIFGGDYAEEHHKLPYMVHLSMRLYPGMPPGICAGSLITTRIVLTAAHCLYIQAENKYFILRPEHVEVLGGTTFLSKGGIRRGVKTILKPEVYTPFSFYMDIAGLILDQPMQGPNIATINLCKYDIPDNKMLMIPGWGQTRKANTNLPDGLKFGMEKKLPDKECETFLGLFYNSNVMFCAKHPLWEEGICKGDSGGPVVYKGELCGVVSWIMNCDEKNYPDVFTKITAAKNFTDKLLAFDVNN